MIALLFAGCGALLDACTGCSSDGPYTAAKVQGNVSQLRDEAVVERVPEPTAARQPVATEPTQEPSPAKTRPKKKARDSSTHAKPRAPERPEPRRVAESEPRECCKYCSKGIPCGDTCISASKTCHKGPGCAC